MKHIWLREFFTSLSQDIGFNPSLYKTSFLTRPVFTHGLSASFHLFFLLLVSSSWLWRRFKPTSGLESSKNKLGRKSLVYKSTLICCLVLASFHLLLCVFNYLWFWAGSSQIDLVATQLDLVVRTLAWFAVYGYLQFEISPNRTINRFPLLLRIWWSIYFFLSSSFIAVDFVCLENHQFVPIRSWVIDSVSIILGSFLCYAGFYVRHEPLDLQEPLLNGTAEEHLDKKSVGPYSTANYFSKFTFSWMNPMFSVGYKKALDLDDLPPLAFDDNASSVYSVFRNRLESECGGSGSTIGTLTLFKALFISIWGQALVTGLLCLLYVVASYVGPYLIDSFVQYLNGEEQFKHQGYVLISAFFIAKLVECFTKRHWNFRNRQIGIRCRSALVAMIYKKGLSMSVQSRQGHTSGEMANLISVDAERAGFIGWYMHDLWMVPVQITLALLILYKNLGLASIAALAATIVIMLGNIPLGKLEERFQDKLMESKDERMKATSEVLRNMRILKLQGWEMKFLSKITDLRKDETSWLRKYFYMLATTTSIICSAPTLVAVITFGACSILGIPLESGRVLSALATFRILQSPIYNLPDAISMIVQIKVSLDRIASFLCLDDLQPDAVEKLPKDACNDIAIEMSNGYFSWDPSSGNPDLKDLNFRAHHGKRVAVCGTVGSGKSSLLSSILGEIPKISGTIRLSGTMAYVSQSPWIQSGKVVDNILFGKEMDKEKYERVLEACALKKDLEILSSGDQTVIGERGINLSGGQKQRIQIARALYQEADIYLFDDPFSAVDAHTGTHLFQECLLGLLSTKTVIYVTHQVEFLPAADLILVMKDGKITQAGQYDSLRTLGTDFLELVDAHQKALSALDSTVTDSPPPTAIKSSEPDGPCNMESNNTGSLHKKDEMVEDQNDKKTDDHVGQTGQLVQEEEREKGSVGFKVYWQYITAAHGGALIPFILLAQILFELLQIGSNYWMAWATPVSDDIAAPVSSSLLILVYVALGIGSALFVLVRSILLVTAGYKTATSLFHKMHLCIFRSPMSFFDATPSGRILNRASTDQSVVDLSIPDQMGDLAFSFIQLLGIIGVMSQVAWQVFIIFIPVVGTCIWYQQYYIPTARELARLTGVSRAPILQHFTETISGAATIRSFDQESRFINKNLELISGYSRPKFYISGAMEWLCARLDMLSCIAFAFSLVFLVSLPKGLIDPGFAGLAVTYGLTLNTQQTSVIWRLCNLENNIISVERMLQYTRIPSEPPLVIETNRPDQTWPSHGVVDIRDLQVRYAPHLPFVLRGLTCTFPGGMKSGIVGRTGCGKTTLVQTLFRLVDPTGGQILIDGIDISSIGLHDLRSRLSIIPQDPTMFEGTVRSNLDPLGEYTDDQIWEALDKCQLGDEVRRNEEKLDSTVTENGENWSVGQRQLVCLGRVLLKKSKILVLDEATASVDTATDGLIQQTLRQHFTDSTVIIIAHRIASVVDSDMVLVLDNGLIAEFDTPANLLQDKSSAFAKLVSEYRMRSAEVQPQEAGASINK